MEELYEGLVCPECKRPLRRIEQALFCAESRLKFPIENGIPVLIVDRAQRLTEEQAQTLSDQLANL